MAPAFGVKTDDLRRVRNVRSADRSAEGVQNGLDRMVAAGQFVVVEEASKPIRGGISFDADVPPKPGQGELLEECRIALTLAQGRLPRLHGFAPFSALPMSLPGPRFVQRFVVLSGTCIFCVVPFQDGQAFGEHLP